MQPTIIGPIVATALVAPIGDTKTFTSARHLAAWLGLVPRQNSSGGKERLGGISKAGDGYLRRMLVHGVGRRMSRSWRRPCPAPRGAVKSDRSGRRGGSRTGRSEQTIRRALRRAGAPWGRPRLDRSRDRRRDGVRASFGLPHFAPKGRQHRRRGAAGRGTLIPPYSRRRPPVPGRRCSLPDRRRGTAPRRRCSPGRRTRRGTTGP